MELNSKDTISNNKIFPSPVVFAEKFPMGVGQISAQVECIKNGNAATYRFNGTQNQQSSVTYAVNQVTLVPGFIKISITIPAGYYPETTECVINL